MSGREELCRRMNEEYNKQGFMALLGARLDSVGEGVATLSCVHTQALAQHRGVMHGGAITALADVACGVAAVSTLPEGEDVMSVEFKINMLRPVAAGRVTAKGQVLKTGRTLVVAEATLTDEVGEIVAKMISTMIRLQQKG